MTRCIKDPPKIVTLVSLGQDSGAGAIGEKRGKLVLDTHPSGIRPEAARRGHKADDLRSSC